MTHEQLKAVEPLMDNLKKLNSNWALADSKVSEILPFLFDTKDWRKISEALHEVVGKYFVEERDKIMVEIASI